MLDGEFVLMVLLLLFFTLRLGPRSLFELLHLFHYLSLFHQLVPVVFELNFSILLVETGFDVVFNHRICESSRLSTVVQPHLVILACGSSEQQGGDSTIECIVMFRMFSMMLFFLFAFLILVVVRQLISFCIIRFWISNLEPVLVFGLSIFFGARPTLTTRLLPHFFNDILTLDIVALNTIKFTHVVVFFSVGFGGLLSADRDLEESCSFYRILSLCWRTGGSLELSQVLLLLRGFTAEFVFLFLHWNLFNHSDLSTEFGASNSQSAHSLHWCVNCFIIVDDI